MARIAPFRLVDTAGVRKKPEAHGAIEYYAALRSLGAIARCDIALLVFDAMTGIMAQDRRLAGIAIEERKGLILVGNKWDLVREQDGDFTQAELGERRPRVDPVCGVCTDHVPFRKDAPPLRQPHADRCPSRRKPRPSRSDRAAQHRDPRRRVRASAIGGLQGGCCEFIMLRSRRRIRRSSSFTATIRSSSSRTISASWKTSFAQHFDFEGVPLTLRFRRAASREEPR